MKLKDLAAATGGELAGGDLEITSVAGIDDAVTGSITFVADVHRIDDLAGSGASAAFVPLESPETPIPGIKVKNPKLAFARALALFYVPKYSPKGISDKAVINLEAVVGADPSIYPFVSVAAGAHIGDRVTLHPGVVVGENAVVGDDSVVYPNVFIGDRVRIGKRVIIHAGAVLGSDGFGFVTDSGKHHKIPQAGGIIVEDDVEIGGNCTIDRATLGNTIIRQGTKIDNQVHVAHNVSIGEHCLIAGQVGIAGSSTLGNYVVFGGQVGVADHISVGDRVMVGGKSAITRDLDPGQIVAGINVMPVREWLKVQAILPKLPELKKLLAKLEHQVQELKEYITEK